MRRERWWLLGLVTATLWYSDAHAQARALIFHTRGGRSAVLENLGPDGDELQAGFAAGGGLGIQLTANLVLRGTALRADSDYRGSTLQLSDPTFRRLFVGADLQVGAPTTTGFAPYLSIGAGTLRVKPVDPGLDDFSRFVGSFGSGVNYVVANFPAAFFVELDMWLYNFSEFGFDRHQVDLLLLAGLAVAVPF